MKHIHHIVLLGVLFFLLQSCNTANKDKSIPNDLNISNNEFFGEWYSVKRMIPFEAVLKIDSNYIFTYEGVTCISNFGSNGYWIINDDTLILNSIKPKSCYYLDNFGVNCLMTNINDSTMSKKVTLIKDCIPKEIDYRYILFENEKFIIKDNALMHIQKPNNFCPDIKDDFTRK